jgi:hypothetical protein
MVTVILVNSLLAMDNHLVMDSLLVMGNLDMEYRLMDNLNI